MKFRGLVAAGGGIALAIMIAACGGSTLSTSASGTTSGSSTSSHAAGSTLKSVTMIDPAPGQPAWDVIERCFKSEASAKGLEATVTGPPGSSAYDLSSLVNLTQQALTSGTQAIALTTSFSAPSFAPLLKQARAKGVYIGTMESGTASPERNFDVGLNITRYAQDAAAHVATMSGNRSVIIMAQQYEGTPKIFIDSFKAAIAKYPSVHYLTAVFDESDTTKDTGLIDNALQAHPNVGVILSANPASTAPVAAAITESHDIDKVRLLAVTRDSPGLAALKSGAAQGLYVQRLCDVGRLSVDNFVALSQGKSVPSLDPVGQAYVTAKNNSQYDSDWG